MVKMLCPALALTFLTCIAGRGGREGGGLPSTGTSARLLVRQPFTIGRCSAQGANRRRWRAGTA